jgi:rod shape-determining protein MreC
MWSLIERLRKIIFVAVLSIIPLVLLYVQSKDEEIRHIVAWPVIEVSGVIEKGALLFSGFVSDALFRYFYMVSRTDELKALRAEVLETRALKAKITDLLKEQDSITKLYFNHTESGLPKGELARVIARAGSPMSRMIRLDRGQAHGIKPNSPVIAYGGAVGQVLSVAPHFSDVLLITDASSALDAKIVGSEARGLLRGITSSTEYLMEIRDIDGQVDVQAGNIVVTSGVNSNFPHGIPIGTVIESSRSRDGLYISARIDPLVMMDRLSRVLVLPIGEHGATGMDMYKAAWPLAVQ